MKCTYMFGGEILFQRQRRLWTSLQILLHVWYSRKTDCVQSVFQMVLFYRTSNYYVPSMLLKNKMQHRRFSKIIKNMLFSWNTVDHFFFIFLFTPSVRMSYMLKCCLEKRTGRKWKIFPPPHPHLMLPGQRENRASPQKGFIYAPFCPSLTLEGWAQRRRIARELTSTDFLKIKWTELHVSARNYRPSFRENKHKTLVFNDWIRAFWACFHENAGL